MKGNETTFHFHLPKVTKVSSVHWICLYAKCERKTPRNVLKWANGANKHKNQFNYELYFADVFAHNSIYIGMARAINVIHVVLHSSAHTHVHSTGCCEMKPLAKYTAIQCISLWTICVNILSVYLHLYPVICVKSYRAREKKGINRQTSFGCILIASNRVRMIRRLAADSPSLACFPLMPINPEWQTGILMVLIHASIKLPRVFIWLFSFVWLWTFFPPTQWHPFDTYDCFEMKESFGHYFSFVRHSWFIRLYSAQKLYAAEIFNFEQVGSNFIFRSTFSNRVVLCYWLNCLLKYILNGDTWLNASNPLIYVICYDKGISMEYLMVTGVSVVSFHIDRVYPQLECLTKKKDWQNTWHHTIDFAVKLVGSFVLFLTIEVNPPSRYRHYWWNHTHSQRSILASNCLPFRVNYPTSYNDHFDSPTPIFISWKFITFIEYSYINIVFFFTLMVSV